MPTTLYTKTIKTLKQFSDFVENQIKKSEEKILWFRGTRDELYKLSPTLHRHPTKKTANSIIELEKQIISRFCQRSIPFIGDKNILKNDWELLFFIQHYAVPTRLLDWTENPFIGLYFALNSDEYTTVSGKKNYKSDAAIWVLDPIKWNRESLKDFTYSGGILSTEDELLNSFKPRPDLVTMREKPVAIFGIHNNPRIVAQRGVFTVSGKSVVPMEDIYVNNNFPEDCLIKLIIPKEKIESLLNSLTAIGIVDSVAYPDLEGFSKELKRFYKFI